MLPIAGRNSVHSIRRVLEGAVIGKAGRDIMAPDTHDLDLRRGFINRQLQLKATLDQARNEPHTTGAGDIREVGWERLLREFLPRRYGVSRSRSIVDSGAATSQQIDIVIYDRQFAPTLLVIDSSEVIPAESVYAAFEVRPSINAENLRYAGDKAASVRRLERHPGRFGTVSGGRSHPPKPIVAGILCDTSDWSSALGDRFEEHLTNLDDARRLDVGCIIDGGAFDYRPEREPDRLNISGVETALIAFCMSLFARLQEIGNATAIDPDRYGADLWES